MFDVNDTVKARGVSGSVLIPDARHYSTFRSLVRGWWVTSRMEYLPDSLVHIALPLLLVLRHERWSSQLFELSLLGLSVWLLGHWVGSSLNCVADYHVDRLDAGHKSRLALAIDGAGVRAILNINLTEIFIATFLSLWLAYSLKKPLLIGFWLVGLLIAYLYSFEPLRFKRRNFLNPLALAIIVYATPLFFVYHLLSPVWDLYDITVLAIYCFQMIPMFLVDEISDYDEDRAMLVNNPCVTYGRVPVCQLAIAIYALSCFASLILFAREAPMGTRTSVSVLILSGLVYLWVIREFVLLARISRSIESTTNAAARAASTHELKAFTKTPAWLVATSISVIFLAGALSYLS
jgi:hypothetical protein